MKKLVAYIDFTVDGVPPVFLCRLEGAPGDSEDHIRELLEFGVLACDCKRSEILKATGNTQIDILPCGDRITIDALKIVEEDC